MDEAGEYRLAPTTDPCMNTHSSSSAPSGWRFDHVNVSVCNTTALSTFFEGVMRLAPGRRPAFPFPGTWLYEGGQALVHAVDDSTLSTYTGELRLGHVAFRSDEPSSQVIDRVKRSGLPFKVAQVPEDNIAQIFVLLPGGLVMELDVPIDCAATDHVYTAYQASPGAANF